ncbi:cellulose synthase interactive 3 [Olea europaea subsp. europaea]|uniref:Cellulose synthase interactive 3 n=1 Tax=Olea europaea subsp. europaea TaxID=158383 RepID=A0A8S0PGZ5_OLEEU|nr:cellulose synthase interactive 3 [Olea europaea subsp. europaea]
MKTRVAQFIEQLHAKKSSPPEKELLTARLLGIAKARKEARELIGSHGQAIPLFISILRSGTPMAKINVAATLSVLCKDEDLRVKVLLGGCIPPLLSLLKSESTEARKAAAEALVQVSSSGLSDDNVGTKIFVTEGVVPALWKQLDQENKTDKVVEGFVTGALRNLCGDKDGYWQATLDDGGVDIIVRLLSSENVATKSNAAALLARLMLAFPDGIPKIIDSGAIKALLGLLDQEKDVSVLASAAEALEALSFKSTDAKKAVVDAGGVLVLIRAVIAPSKEGMQGEVGLALQRHATRALANIYGGMSALILHLGELSQSPRLAAPVPDIILALSYCLMVFEQSADEEPFDSTKIESILAMLLKPRDNKLFQECLFKALGNLYGNAHLSVTVGQSESKRVLVGLVTMAAGDAQEYLILALIRLCTESLGVWEAIGKREGIQLLISSLGLCDQKHQQYAVEMLAILTEQNDDSKWAITAAGGIPPLVQILEAGSQKAKEDAAVMLWNLCCHSEDIRACVESAGAISAFLGILKDGGPKGQEASVKALIKLIRKADSATINQLLALLLGDIPRSKAHIIKVLGHVLSIASDSDLVHKGAAANKGLRSLVQVLNSSNKKTQEHAASILADLFSKRHDICDSLATDEVVNPCIELLTGKTQVIAARPTKSKSKNKISYAEGDYKQLIKLAKTSSIDSAEVAMAALANMLLDPQIASDALGEDIVSAITRILGKGSLQGKKSASRALHQLLKHFPAGNIFSGSAQCQFAVLAILDSLNAMDMDGNDVAHTLEIVALFSRMNYGINSTYQLCSILAEVPSSLEPLVQCLCDGPPLVQDKAIEILCRLCGVQPRVLADLLISYSRSIAALANRIMKSSSGEVKVGGTTLIICAAKDHKIQSMDALKASGSLEPLIRALVDMTKQNSTCSSLQIEVKTPRGIKVQDPVTVLGSTVAMWLLSIISAFHSKSKFIVMEAEVLEVLSDNLAKHTSNDQVDYEDTESTWISALLVAILFQDASIVCSPTAMNFIPTLSLLLKSDEMINKFFAAQAIASIVSHGDKGTNLAIANLDAVSGLITLSGNVESDMQNLIDISEEFSLVKNPGQVVLECLFQTEDARLNSIAHETIPLLVNLLRPIPERPGAPPFAVQILIQIANVGDTNKLLIAEAGALDALSKYLSLSPKDSTEATICELLRILFGNSDLLLYEAAVSCMNQLIAVLHLGSRSARLSAALALDELFDAESIRDSEASMQAIQPLVDMLNSALEHEQQVAISALIKLTSENEANEALLAEVEGNPLESLLRLLSSSASLKLKSDAAVLCSVLFDNPRVRGMPIASECIEHLLLLIQSNQESAVESGLTAFERLLDDREHVDLASAHDVVGLLVSLVSGSNFRLIEASICCLIKFGRDRTSRKLDMVNAGIIDSCLELLLTAPYSLFSTIAELFRILTNSSAISISSAAVKIVEPLFTVLLQTDFDQWGQHSALQALVNILEKPQNLATLELTPTQVVEYLIPFLESPSQDIQQLSTDLLSHLLEQEDFKQDIKTMNATIPLVQLAGIGILNLQETAVKALENISLSWPEAVADAGGILELSRVILQDNPRPSDALWELAAVVLCNVLQFNADYYFKVPIEVLVRILHSTSEGTFTLALNALIVQEKSDASSAELMAEAGAIDALLDLLRSHQSEEAAGRLLEILCNNTRVQKMKVSKKAIAPLAQYLLDPETTSQTGKLFAALSLGGLSHHEGLARSNDSVSACRALISLLEDKTTEQMKMVAVCALQNFVMHSRTNRRFVAEAGGAVVIQELLLSPNSDTAGQAALLVKYIFSSHALQEHVSNELISSLTAALERELLSTATVNEEILRTMQVIFVNFQKLHSSEAATLCIPHLIAALKSGSETVQDSVLTILCLLKQSWPAVLTGVSKSQAMIVAEAIPTLQLLSKTCPASFQDRAESLLRCLPGCLTVMVKRANNLKRVMGGTNPFCRLTISNGSAKQTTVVYHTNSPEWNEGFKWAFDVPPKGQNLNISCKSKNTFKKATLGRVAIPMDKIINEGNYSDIFSLSHNSDNDGSSRTLEVEITWSNRTSSEKCVK